MLLGFAASFFPLLWEVWKPACWLPAFHFPILPFLHLFPCKNPAIRFFGGSQNTLWNRGSRTLFSQDGKHPFHVPLVLLTVEMVSGMLKVISWEPTGFCDRLLWGNSGLNKLSGFSAIELAGIIYVLSHLASLRDMNRAFTFKQAPLAMQSHCYRKPWREPMSQGNFEKRNSRPVIFYDHRQSSSPSQPSTSHPWNDRVGLLPKDC